MSETTPTNKEMAQRFVQFIMMQAQNVLYVLGRYAGPDGSTPPPNLDAGKMLIDQLDMIAIKTKGNLLPQEEKILNETISELKLAFVEASGGTPVGMMPSRAPRMDIPELDELDDHATPASAPAAPSQSEPAPAPAPAVADSRDDENKDKKKFFKSYG